MVTVKVQSRTLYREVQGTVTSQKILLLFVVPMTYIGCCTSSTGVAV